MAADRLPLRIALAAGATLATLVACEIAARILLAPPRYHREPVELDPELGFRGIPDYRQEYADDSGHRYAFELGSEGLRGREVPASAPRGASRLAFVGDSFLVGQALREEELATSLVEAALRSEGRDVEVYNLSGVDFGTAQELLLLRRLGPRMRPEAVVLFLYPANDLVNNSIGLAERTSVSAGDPIRPYLVPGADGRLELRYLHPARALLRRHSRLFATLERRLLAAGASSPPAEDPVERLRQGRAPREDFEIFRAHLDPREAWSEAWRTSFAVLRAFRAECDAIGARLLVVVIPSVHQVVRNAKGIRLDLVARSARGQTLDAMLDWDRPERELARFFEAEGIDARFLLGPLRAASAAGERVYGRDEHLSARGQALAADAVLEWLVGEPGAPRRPFLEADTARPVRVLPGGSASRSFLDFRSDPHPDYLGDGWISWSPGASDGAAGWLVGSSALAVLAPADGALVLRGWGMPDASYPIAGSVAILGGPRHRFRVERAGRFAFRFPAAEPGGAVPPTSEGHLALILSFDAARAGAAAGALRIDALGFETGHASDAGPG